MLWAAAALALIGGLPALTIAIVAVVVVNALFSFWQEYRADLGGGSSLPTCCRPRRSSAGTGCGRPFRQQSWCPATSSSCARAMPYRPTRAWCGRSGCASTNHCSPASPSRWSETATSLEAGSVGCAGARCVVLAWDIRRLRVGRGGGRRGRRRRRRLPRHLCDDRISRSPRDAVETRSDRAVRAIAASAVGAGVAFFARPSCSARRSSGRALHLRGRRQSIRLLDDQTLGDAPALPRALRQTDGGAARARASSRVGRDARVDHRHLHGQDRHSHQNEMTVRAVATADGTRDVTGAGYDPRCRSSRTVDRSRRASRSGYDRCCVRLRCATTRASSSSTVGGGAAVTRQKGRCSLSPARAVSIRRCWSDRRHGCTSFRSSRRVDACAPCTASQAVRSRCS